MSAFPSSGFNPLSLSNKGHSKLADQPQPSTASSTASAIFSLPNNPTSSPFSFFRASPSVPLSTSATVPPTPAMRTNTKQRRVSTSAVPTIKNCVRDNLLNWTFRDEMGIIAGKSGQPMSDEQVLPAPDMTRAKKGKIRKVVRDDDENGIASAAIYSLAIRPGDDTNESDDPERERERASGKEAAREKEKKPRKMWTKEETQMLVDGCNIWGVGNWKAILNDPKFEFQDRSPVDLKDRFRTYFPDAYRQHYPNAKTHLSDRVRSSLPDGTSIFEKTRSKKRRPFTPEEDEALRRGYEKHGTVWAVIVKDPIFVSRRSTDLRDRFRNAFPDLYAKAGYKPRPTRSMKKSRSEPFPDPSESPATATGRPPRRKRASIGSSVMLQPTVSTSNSSGELYHLTTSDSNNAENSSMDLVDSPLGSEDEGSSYGEEEIRKRPSSSSRSPSKREKNLLLPPSLSGSSSSATELHDSMLKAVALPISDQDPSHHRLETLSQFDFSESHPSSVSETPDDASQTWTDNNWISNSTSPTSDFLFGHQPTNTNVSANARIGKSAWMPQDWLSSNPRLETHLGGPLMQWPSSISEQGVLDRYDLYSVVSNAHDFASEAGPVDHYAQYPDESIWRGFTHHRYAGDLISGSGVAVHPPHLQPGMASIGDMSVNFDFTSPLTGSQLRLGQLSLEGIDEVVGSPDENEEQDVHHNHHRRHPHHHTVGGTGGAEDAMQDVRRTDGQDSSSTQTLIPVVPHQHQHQHQQLSSPRSGDGIPPTAITPELSLLTNSHDSLGSTRMVDEATTPTSSMSPPLPPLPSSTSPLQLDLGAPLGSSSPHSLPGLSPPQQNQLPHQHQHQHQTLLAQQQPSQVFRGYPSMPQPHGHTHRSSSSSHFRSPSQPPSIHRNIHPQQQPHTSSTRPLSLFGGLTNLSASASNFLSSSSPHYPPSSSSSSNPSHDEPLALSTAALDLHYGALMNPYNQLGQSVSSHGLYPYGTNGKSPAEALDLAALNNNSYRPSSRSQLPAYPFSFTQPQPGQHQESQGQALAYPHPQQSLTVAPSALSQHPVATTPQAPAPLVPDLSQNDNIPRRSITPTPSTAIRNHHRAQSVSVAPSDIFRGARSSSSASMSDKKRKRVSWDGMGMGMGIPGLTMSSGGSGSVSNNTAAFVVSNSHSKDLH